MTSPIPQPVLYKISLQSRAEKQGPAAGNEIEAQGIIKTSFLISATRFCPDLHDKMHLAHSPLRCCTYFYNHPVRNIIPLFEAIGHGIYYQGYNEG